jgi:SAM-dependent methyltransferase
MEGEVRFRRGKWRVSDTGSVISNQINCDMLAAFLERNYSGNGNSSVLDLGAGAKPYAPMYETYFSENTEVDVPHGSHDMSGIDVFASADALPLSDESFDCVICTEVLEHCQHPQAVMKEIARVLKPDGRACLTTPFYQQLHEVPYDFYRYTPWALEGFAKDAGLKVESITPRGGYVAVALRILLVPVVKLMKRLPFSRPLRWLMVTLPQKLYLAFRRGGQTYFPLGYVTELRKPR